MIGDCTDLPNILETEKKRNINSLIYHLLFYPLNPGSLVVINFKLFLVIYTLFSIIYLPLIFGFDLNLSGEFISINAINIVVFLIEMFTRFRISYYEMGDIVTDRKKISLK